MTPGDPAQNSFESGLEATIPVVYRQTHAQGKGYTYHALDSLRRLQRIIGGLMLLTAAAGVYLLATDGSLWILAVSHAIGLAVIVLLDLSLGVMNLMGWKRVYLASIAAACLGIALQLGDIATAPQYNMTMPYFASYLFGLAAWDIQLSLQGVVIFLGIVGRSNVEFLASKRRVAKELNYSRRSFVTTMVGFAVLIGLGVALGSVKIPSSSTSSSPASTAQVAGPSSPITNTNSMQTGSPVYFEYPAGYPNVLFKRSDGTLAAFSMLCTHVCCETTYEASTSVFYCPCHGSEFDSSGKVIRGPASNPLPSITLTVDSSGDIYPTAVSGYTPC
jgi:Rieske Fe-S protein